jgi:mannose-1-phosphate guanylyltransferase
VPATEQRQAAPSVTHSIAGYSSARNSRSDHVALVGVAPPAPEVEYGWIVCGGRIGHKGAYRIARFDEKPSHAVAEQLFRGGGLWNTFISAARAEVFWEVARRHLPLHVTALERFAHAIGGPSEAVALDAAYGAMPPANFSHDVLAHTRSLAVLPVAGTGWSDWGSPKRVFASLAGTPNHDRLVERIRGTAA